MNTPTAVEVVKEALAAFEAAPGDIVLADLTTACSPENIRSLVAIVEAQQAEIARLEAAWKSSFDQAMSNGGRANELRRALEVIAVGDSEDPKNDAADELVALGYWDDNARAALGKAGE